MSEYVTTMTQRWQVTVPKEVRQLLGLKPREQVVFDVQGQEVRLKPVRWTLESVAGSVEPLPGAATDLDEQIRQAKEEVATRYVEKMNRL